MNAERLLQLYHRVSEAPDAIPRLRRFILDLAVRGKLVEQDPNDEPASELLRRIAREKAGLIKAGEISNATKNRQAVSVDLPFRIRRGWCPARIQDLLLEIQTGPFGSSLHKRDYQKGGTPVINPASLQNEKIVPLEKMAVGAQTLERLKSFKLRDGDIVMARRGEMGRCAVVTTMEAGWLCGTGSLILRPSRFMYDRFLVLVLGSPFGRAYLSGSAVGSTMQNLNQSILLDLGFGLPPYPEQRRIVAKVDELMALCDCLEAERKKREATRDHLTTASLSRLTAPDVDEKQFKAHADFAIRVLPELTTRPDQIKVLRQTILDLAVRGKLVEQDPSDEPASGLLERILPGAVKNKHILGVEDVELKKDELPAIPFGWQWSSLANICVRIHYGYTASADPTLKEVRLLRITDIQDNLVRWETVPGCDIDGATAEKFTLKPGDILIARTGGTIGKTFLVSEVPVTAVFASYLIRIQPAPSLCVNYLKLFCESDLYWAQLREGSRGGGQPNVNAKTLGYMRVPIPPVAEQRQIVAKTNSLLAVVDTLERNLVIGQMAKRLLLQASLKMAVTPSSKR